MQISNESKMLELEYEINAQEFGPADDHVQSYIFILVTLIFCIFINLDYAKFSQCLFSADLS